MTRPKSARFVTTVKGQATLLISALKLLAILTCMMSIKMMAEEKEALEWLLMFLLKTKVIFRIVHLKALALLLVLALVLLALLGLVNLIIFLFRPWHKK